jgi:isoleucyl-tRNA synthetase
LQIGYAMLAIGLLGIIINYGTYFRFIIYLITIRLSRNRYWGNPIPLWVSDDYEEVVCVGSIEELKELSGVQDITDLHKEFVDKITIPSKQGKGVLRRVPEVFDCWFESGSMPYAQSHYPFEKKEEFEANFPADFIAEGIDQTRGWFYTLLVISTVVFDKPPFKNLITNGLVLASDGKKMSKRLKNYPDPVKVITDYGADSIRIYLISSPAVHGDALKFNEKGVRDVIKDAFLPWHNALKFLLQNIDLLEAREKGYKFNYEEIKSFSGDNIMDKWILSSIESLLQFVRQEMDKYHLYTVLPRLIKFIDTLCNWYVRLNRKRFRGETSSDDCKLALNTLFNVLFAMLRLFSPFVPFITESMYLRLKPYISEAGNKIEYKSIHFLSVPECNQSLIETNTENLVGLMQKVILIGRVIRDRKNLPLRHPIKKLVIVIENHNNEEAKNDASDAISIVKPYIFDELNVKELELTHKRQDYGIEMKAKANFPVLASKAKDKMKVLSAAIEKMSDDDVQKLCDTNSFELNGYKLEFEDVKITPKCDTSRFGQYEADFDGNVIVLLDTTPDEEMVNEGVLRDIGNRIQRLRKDLKIVPTDEIVVYFNVADQNSKLNNLMKKSIEFVENTIKKPFKQYVDGLELKSAKKVFDVRFTF